MTFVHVLYSSQHKKFSSEQMLLNMYTNYQTIHTFYTGDCFSPTLSMELGSTPKQEASMAYILIDIM